MPDITKCKGDGCPLKESCYRFTALDSPHAQWIFGGVPYDAETKSCEQYWGKTQESILEQLNEIVK